MLAIKLLVFMSSAMGASCIAPWPRWFSRMMPRAWRSGPRHRKANSCLGRIEATVTQWRQVIASEACHGPGNGRVCDPGAFPNHFGSVDAGRARGFLARAQTNATKTPPTPWLTVGDFAFTGNEYLDFIVYSLFFKERAGPGTYAEMGGSNGVHASNTYFFDHGLGWDGALIEPTACGKCQMPFNRPRATNIQAGVCDTSQTRDFSFMRAFCPPGQTSGCAFDDEHVPCEPMSALFAQSGLTHIDFFSLDIETEFKTAFDTIDFDKTPISVFLMECNVPDEKGKKECESMMAGKGYEFAWVTGNDILGWQPEARPKMCA